MKIQHPVQPFSKIKDLYLEVANCDFFHGHLGESDTFFLGRKKAKDRLKMVLLRSKSRSGAYLVTGFRGMGKTSLVHQTLTELEREHNLDRPFEKIAISLSQDDVRDMDVLRLIARQLYEKWGEVCNRTVFYKEWRKLIIAAIGMLCGVYLIQLEPHQTIYSWKALGILFCVASALYAFRVFAKTLFQRSAQYAIRKRLAWLNSRLDAAVSRESSKSVSSEFSLPGEVGKFRFFDRQYRENASYQIATSKEIEKELITIFEAIDQFRTLNNKSLRTGKNWIWPSYIPEKKILRTYLIPEFVFILDELDKIEPDFLTTPTPSESNQHSATIAQNVQRRETIASLLSNLKSFLNEAKAKFIFIGGRDMFDASLADIADRESFYGSIFNDVIYINSFFKDKIQQRSGVTRITEAYLCHLLIPNWYLKKFIKSQDKRKQKDTDTDEWYNLGTLYHYLVDSQRQKTGEKVSYEYKNAILTEAESRLAIYKILYQLQNFVVYLTYRSNGTPKKLAGLLEQFIVPGNPGRTPGHGETGSFMCDLNFDPKQESFGNDIVLFCPPKPGKELPGSHDAEGRLFFKFNFNQQYEVNLTSNLYRPYVIIHSRYLKAMGDKLLYSTSYIMDYILKFHPHGFSWRNLEMIPDIILTNKDPNLRAFMQELMQFLSRMYIRETINGMFQFKFYIKIVNEIRFLSKISELGTAAFNFTLDESQQIKYYYRDKLNKQLKQHQEPVQFSAGSAPFIHSVSFLHNLLGDLHYYDKEYDDAIIHYSDAAQPLRARLHKDDLTNHQVVLLVRTQLKLGMALERIRAFDSAYSIYRSLIMEMPHLLRLKKWSDEDIHVEPSADKPLRRMQLFVRPYIAILDLVEKQRIDGVTFSNLRRNLEDLNILLESNRLYPLLPVPGTTKGDNTWKHYFTVKKQTPDPSPHKDSTRLNTLYSDYFSNVGSILYFKNYNYPEIYTIFRNGFEEEKWGKYQKENSGFGELQEKTLAEFIRSHRTKGNGSGYVADYNPSLTSYIYYRQAISDQVASYKETLLEVIRGDDENGDFYLESDNDIVSAVLLLHPEVGFLTNSMQQYIMGNLFSKLGDAVLSSAGPDIQPLEEAVLDIYEYDDAGGNFKECLKKCLEYLRDDKFPFGNCLNAALVLYRVAGLFFLKSNRSFSYAFQFKKFLFVIKDWLAFRGNEWIGKKRGVLKREEKSRRKTILRRLEDLLVTDIHGGDLNQRKTSVANRLLHSITWTADVANRPQLLKYREIFHVDRTDDTVSIYNNISTSAESREVVILIEEIRLKLICLGASSSALNMEQMITPYDAIVSKYLRVFELKYKCEYNFALFRKFDESHQQKATLLLKVSYYKFKKTNPQKWATFKEIWREVSASEEREMLENAILDAIFCLYEVIRILNIYGISYVTNHSFLANAHYKLANWCRAFENFKAGHLSKFKKNSEAYRQEGRRFDDKLIALLGTDALYALEPNYHDEQAIEHYYAAVQTHNGGRSYRDNVTNMSFLEDDLNDNMTHFCAATERFRVNTGIIRDKINTLKNSVAESQLYILESYRGVVRRNSEKPQ